MNLLLKIPLDLKKIASFFIENQHSVLRDFTEIICMTRKSNFAKRALEFFNKNWQIFKEENELSDDYYVIFDGFENFAIGMPIYCFGAIYKNNIFTYDLQNNIFYWGNDNEFFVNGIRVRLNRKLFNPNYHLESRNISGTCIPEFLSISWYLAGIIYQPVYENKIFDIILSINNK